jgi:single-strand DNA-binding protein
MSLNKVMLIGNVGKDPEVTTLDKGGKVAKFTLATSEKYTDKSGNKTERTDWHNIVAWGPLADLVEKYVVKGKQLYLEGQIRNRSWEQDGVKKFATDINITQLVFLSNGNGASNGKSESSSSSSETSKSSTAKKTSTAKAPEPVVTPAMDDTDEDLPF